MQGDKGSTKYSPDWPDTEPVANVHIDLTRLAYSASIAMLYPYTYKVHYLALSLGNTMKGIKTVPVTFPF